MMRITLKPLNQQVIVITGASSGIGLATAKAAAKRGAKVVLGARNADALKQAEVDIRAAGGAAIHVVTDVTKRDDLEALAAAAILEYGTFDTWVNDAGSGIYGRLEEITEEDSRRLFDVNFWGLVNGTLIAAKHLKASGGGAIINLGSVVSDIGFPVQGMYSASKHAIMGFTDAFRMEMLEEGAPLSVTLIKPSAINTPFPRHAKNVTAKTPTLPPPVYSPRDVAGAILHAAEHGGRDYYVGGAGKLMSTLNKSIPRLVDWFGANFVSSQSLKNQPSARDDAGNLFKAVEDGHASGDSDYPVMRSAYTWAVEHPALAGAAVVALGTGVIGLLNRGNRS